jgi:hypothetical protein
VVVVVGAWLASDAEIGATAESGEPGGTGRAATETCERADHCGSSGFFIADWARALPPTP